MINMIRFKENKICLFCKKEGELLYKNLNDKLFGIEGKWEYLYCPDCEFIWLTPLPIESDVKFLYSKYVTHNISNEGIFCSLRNKIKFSIIRNILRYRHIPISNFYNLIGKIISFISPLREMAQLSIMLVPYVENGWILDIGCGNGSFLNTMQKLGWKVCGVEFDCYAANIARYIYKIPLVYDSIESIKEHYFDAITFHHVLEHLYNPIEVLKRCARLLKPKGRIVIVTPNINSLTHKMFNKYCIHFDAPRHFYLFSLKSIKRCVQQVTGVRIEKLFTTGRWAHSTYMVSKNIKKMKDPFKYNMILQIESIIFRLIEIGVCFFNKEVGEEIVSVLVKSED